MAPGGGWLFGSRSAGLFMPLMGRDIPSCETPDRKKKQFFFENKNQKTLFPQGSPRAAAGNAWSI
jgi:hypothetical protein